MSELITTSSAYIINGDSPMTLIANTVAMTTLAVHTLQPLIFYSLPVRTSRAASRLFIICLDLCGCRVLVHATSPRGDRTNRIARLKRGLPQ